MPDRVLCVHQGFPAQFAPLVKALLHNGFRVDALHHQPCGWHHPHLHLHRWSPRFGSTPGLIDGLTEVESKFIRAESAARVAERLEEKGYRPDLILAHPGWGESLYLRSIWPSVPQLHYLEFYYSAMGPGSDLESGMDGLSSSERRILHRRVQAKNVCNLMALQDMAWGIAPTRFQASTYPAPYRSKISVIHDGIDTHRFEPDQQASLRLPSGLVLDRNHPVITFVNRSFEPYRGFPQFMRALPTVLQRVPNAHVLLIGNCERVTYGLPPADGRTWKDVLLKELGERLDTSNVHFLGTLKRGSYIRALQLSRCHVYLTVPFVLSWSLLEAMACAAPIVASNGPSIRDVIEDGVHASLVDHHNTESLASAIVSTITERSAAIKRGQRARDLVKQHYGMIQCTNKRFKLLQALASGSLNPDISFAAT